MNLNFLRFKLVLQGAKAERTVLSFTPTVDLAVLTTKEALVSTTNDMADASHYDVLYEHGGVFESHRVVDSELAVFIRTHGVQVVIVSHEAGVTVTARDLPDRDIVRAELWEGVHLVTS